MNTKSVNPNAQPEVNKLLEYFNSIEGKAFLTGQHTQTRRQEELELIKKETGKLPALCGFELLSYSPNINLEGATEACITEVMENRNTLEEAWAWVEKGGILTFTWHWFSPIGGEDKAFYTEHTNFDAALALQEGTPENKAFVSDLDHMAEVLKPFCEKHVPILWRPFHECEGIWFWWGAKGLEVARQLYRFMFNYYTKHHHLDNLIWVWNNPKPEGYVGDDYCDIITRDQYPEAHKHESFNDRYLELRAMTKAEKGFAIAETGIIPDGDAVKKDKTPWLWYMTWSKDFCLTENFNSFDALRKLYNCDNAITLDKLNM
ncbi:MAG: glycoside hydrolase family 26 protein [Treponema sp.]|nr:glycoside hydrolase family 26 protein [Treponema sp.]